MSLKYLECRIEVICQFLTAKSLLSIHSPKFYPCNILPRTIIILHALNNLNGHTLVEVFDYFLSTVFCSYN